MSDDKTKVKYKPLGIKFETYRKLNEKKGNREIEIGRPMSFDELINELLEDAKRKV